MSKPIIFTSDIHLAKNRPDLTHLFEVFIQKHAINAQQVYFIGDLFEAWIGDDHNCPFYQKIISLIKSLSQKNIQTFFIPGNRDFLIGKNFCQACNMHLYQDPSMINFENKKILLSHGDIFCTDDHTYQVFRQKIQHPDTINKILKLPLSIRKLLAWYLRMRSKKQFSKVTPIDLKKFDANIQSVLNKMHETNADIIIHGHTHIPGIDLILHGDGKKHRYVLSDWGKQGNYLLLKPGEFPQHCYFRVFP